MISRARRRVSLLFLVALSVALGWYIPRVLFLSDTRAEALAYTECPWASPARVTLTARVTPEDSLPVLAHERVHAAQCDALGPLRYRWRNITAKGRMSLEAPAYCAGARERVRLGLNVRRVRERLIDDATSAFHGRLEPDAIEAALVAACPEIVGGTFVRGRTRQFRDTALVIFA